jgi:hypothetical protein
MCVSYKFLSLNFAQAQYGICKCVQLNNVLILYPFVIFVYFHSYLFMIKIFTSKYINFIINYVKLLRVRKGPGVE